MAYYCPNCKSAIDSLTWNYHESHGHTVTHSERSPDKIHIDDYELEDDTPFNQRFECPECGFMITDSWDTAKTIVMQMDPHDEDMHEHAQWEVVGWRIGKRDGDTDA